MTDFRAQAEEFGAFLVAHTKGRRIRKGDELHGNCPLEEHPDKHPSFGYSIDKDAWSCSCGSGKGSDLRQRLGWKSANGNGNGANGPPPKPVPVAFYDYTDEAGTILYQVVRYQPKGFRQRRPNGDGGYIWDLGNVRRVLYRHLEFKGMEQLRILVCDGEKDVNTAWDLGYPATCCPGGMGSWKREYGAFLKGFKVAVAIDKDGGKGERQAEKVLALLAEDGIEAHAFEFPGDDVKDLTDWKEAGGTLQALEDLVEQRVDWRKVLEATPVPAIDLKPLIGLPIPYVIRPLLVRGSLTQLQGTQKGGKSAFANYLALLASLGCWQKGGKLWAKEPLRIAYISWEDPKIMMTQKLHYYLKGLGLDGACFPINLTYFFRPYMSIEEKTHLQATKQLVKDLELDILILDTLAHVHGQDENDNSAMRRPMANLAALAEDMNISVLYLHHIAKMAGDRTPQDKSRGASAIAAAWHILVDWGVREEGSNVNPVIVQSKFLHKYPSWDIEYIHDGTEEAEPTYVRWDIRSSESATGVGVLDQTWRVLAKAFPERPSGVSRYDVAQMLEISSDTAKDRLLMLVARGMLMKSVVGGGKGKQTLFKPIPGASLTGGLSGGTGE